jgi:hypothetical protein
MLSLATGLSCSTPVGWWFLGGIIFAGIVVAGYLHMTGK